jgi:hypothetical protein
MSHRKSGPASSPAGSRLAARYGPLVIHVVAVGGDFCRPLGGCCRGGGQWAERSWANAIRHTSEEFTRIAHIGRHRPFALPRREIRREPCLTSHCRIGANSISREKRLIARANMRETTSATILRIDVAATRASVPTGASGIRRRDRSDVDQSAGRGRSPRDQATSNGVIPTWRRSEAHPTDRRTRVTCGAGSVRIEAVRARHGRCTMWNQSGNCGMSNIAICLAVYARLLNRILASRGAMRWRNGFDETGHC